MTGGCLSKLKRPITFKRGGDTAPHGMHEFQLCLKEYHLYLKTKTIAFMWNKPQEGSVS